MSSRARTQQRKALRDGPEIGRPIHTPPVQHEMGTKYGPATMLIRNKVTGDSHASSQSR